MYLLILIPALIALVAIAWAFGKHADTDPKCPLRDGFDKESELQYLEVV